MKLTTSQRQELRQWIKICRIRGLSLKATMQVVNQQLPPESQLSYRSIQHHITLIKQESKSWLNMMAFDVYEFVHELKERWDEFHELKTEAWKMLEKAKQQGDIETQIKAASLLCKINDQLLEMDMLLPQIGIPKAQHLQQQQYQPMSDPIFDEKEDDMP